MVSNSIRLELYRPILFMFFPDKYFLFIVSSRTFVTINYLLKTFGNQKQNALKKYSCKLDDRFKVKQCIRVL